MNCREYRDLIAAHVDGVLAYEESQRAQMHLGHCETCRKMFVWESKVRDAIKAHLTPVAPLPEIKERIQQRLNQRGRFQEMLGWCLPKPRLVGSLALLGVLVLATLLWRDSGQPDFLGFAVDQHQMVLAETPEASRPGGLSTPATRRLDLSSRGFRLTINRVSKVNGREQRLSLFEKPPNGYVLAQEYEGAKLAIAKNAKVIRGDNREFVSYTRKGVNLVAWKDDTLLCILTSGLPTEALLALAKQIATES